MELADEGDLLKKIKEHKRNGTIFLESEIWSIFIQVVNALKVLHSMGILHRDIKSSNILLSHNFRVKLGDFNISKIIKDCLATTQTGTPYYASPEIWREEEYGPKSDIWSLGCVLYEATTLELPFKAADMNELHKVIEEGSYIKVQRYNDIAKMIACLLQVLPKYRPSCGIPCL